MTAAEGQEDDRSAWRARQRRIGAIVLGIVTVPVLVASVAIGIAERSFPAACFTLIIGGAACVAFGGLVLSLGLLVTQRRRRRSAER